MIRPLLLTVALALAGCTETLSAPLVPLNFRPALDVDPNPQDNTGIFIPNVNPSSCYLNLTSSIVDLDKDWLDDACEAAIASAFSPEWHLALDEPCPGREPVWAATFFPDVQRVRIAYMPAYYNDCGTSCSITGCSSGHAGDSEFAMVEVMYYQGLGHWVLQQIWLSAHYGEGPVDRSRWVDASSVEYPDRPFGYPRIWASKKKHANYATLSMCGSGQFESQCTFFSQYVERFAITASRNAGSRHADFLQCIPSYGDNAVSGRCESFYTRRPFNGWYPAGLQYGNGVTPYSKILLGDHFDIFGATGAWSAGPNPPGWEPSKYARISGPAQVQSGAQCHWFIQTNLTPGTIQWFVDGDVVSTEADFWYSASEDFTLGLVISDGITERNDARIVSILPTAPACGQEW